MELPPVRLGAVSTHFSLGVFVANKERLMITLSPHLSGLTAFDLLASEES